MQAGALAALSYLGAAAEGPLPAVTDWRVVGMGVVPALKDSVHRLLPAQSRGQTVAVGVLVSRWRV